MNIFVEVLNEKFLKKSFFCNKTKTKAFLENRAHRLFLDIKKNFTKRNFRQTSFDLGQLELLDVGIYLLKVNNRSTRARCEICSKLTIKTPERRQASFWCLYF